MAPSQLRQAALLKHDTASANLACHWQARTNRHPLRQWPPPEPPVILQTELRPGKLRLRKADRDWVGRRHMAARLSAITSKLPPTECQGHVRCNKQQSSTHG